MDWTTISAAVGASTGILSLLGIIYMLGYKFSRIETRLDLIWSIFVEDALRDQMRRVNLTHSSPYKLRRDLQPTKFLPIETARMLCSVSHLSDQKLAMEIISQVGFSYISHWSMESGMTTQEYLAMCVGAVRTVDST